jgi:hypothetical protein
MPQITGGRDEDHTLQCTKEPFVTEPFLSEKSASFKEIEVGPACDVGSGSDHSLIFDKPSQHAKLLAEIHVEPKVSGLVCRSQTSMRACDVRHSPTCFSSQH